MVGHNAEIIITYCMKSLIMTILTLSSTHKKKKKVAEPLSEEGKLLWVNTAYVGACTCM
jgi:hypothetical protein